MNDALCLGAPDALGVIPERKTLVRAVGTRRPPDAQTARPPRQPRAVRATATTALCSGSDRATHLAPVIGTGASCSGAIASGDLVRINHPKRRSLRGYAALDKKRGRVAVTQDGKPLSVMTRAAVLLARNHGYRVSTTTND